jgi:hypothetical protein
MTAQNITSLFLRPRTFSAGALRDAASSAEGRHGDFALAAGHRLNAIGSLTGRSSSGTRCLRLIGSTSRSAPAARRRWRDADLDPAAAPTGSIRAIDLLRNDAFGTEQAGVREDDRASSTMCSLNRMPASVLRNSRASAFLRSRNGRSQILAVMLDEVEGIEDRGVRSLPAAQLFEP